MNARMVNPAKEAVRLLLEQPGWAHDRDVFWEEQLEGPCPFDARHGLVFYNVPQQWFICWPCLRREQKRDRLHLLTGESVVRMFGEKAVRDAMAHDLDQFQGAWEAAEEISAVELKLLRDAVAMIRGVAEMAQQVGDELRARCPLPDHEDRNPSFSINVKTGLWKCWGCQRKGNGRTLLRLMGETA